jgi:hypothetical protein
MDENSSARINERRNFASLTHTAKGIFPHGPFRVLSRDTVRNPVVLRLQVIFVRPSIAIYSTWFRFTCVFAGSARPNAAQILTFSPLFAAFHLIWQRVLDAVITVFNEIITAQVNMSYIMDGN